MTTAGLLLLGWLAAGPDVHPMRVPPALAAETSMPEPSGIAWSAALQRYLLVSDDTGLAEKGTRHAPIVLALAPDGSLDAEPIRIDGLEKLNDPEAICAGPRGTFFIVTSHSPNREGRTPGARRQLLLVAPRQRTLALLGRLDLTGGDTGALLGSLGLDPRGRLDIEALAFREGALFVGLKSPLGAAGEAVIARLSNPVQVVREGRLPAGALSRWGELPLCLDVKGRRVCQGIADMTFLADGSLVVAANSPKGGAPDGGGALWLVPAPVRSSAPRLLRHFSRLKPEGIEISPGGRKLVIVFDSHGDPPLWSTMDVPVAAPR